MSELSKSEWLALYEAAIAFQQAAPWEWMGNEDLFAIENPADGQMGYCSILGIAGMEFGLGMFVGDDGYDRFARMIAEEAEDEGFEEIMMSRSISMLFSDRDDLQKEDREIIRSLGLRFRGRNAWPLFRSQQPGYFPWFLEREEVLFLTSAIQQALVVAREVKMGKLDLLEGEPGNLVFTRFNRDNQWHSGWREAPKLNQQQETHTENIDLVKEAELHLLCGQKGKSNQHWELDIFALPVPIGPNKDRPHFPLCFLAVEAKRGLILGTNLTEPWLTFSGKQDEVIQIIRKANQLPLKIRVKSEKVRRIVEPITRILGIKLQVGPLPELEQAKASLGEYLSML